MILKTDESAGGVQLEKLRVGAVSYLNTKPLIYGFENGLMKDQVQLVIDYPSNIAKALLEDEIDIGLVPVAVIPKLKDYYVISNYCISSDGAVESVGIFSEVPIEQIETLLLDYQSRTSVMLARVLLQEYWKINPLLINAGTDFENEIKGKTAAVIIGDRALAQHQRSKYYYDLGLAWKEYTGLPFVFAAWISNKKVSQSFIDVFNSANEFGLQNLDEVINRQQGVPVNLKNYYTRFIQYRLSAEKYTALNLFLEKIKPFETIVV